jgi:hypothetical protein
MQIEIGQIVADGIAAAVGGGIVAAINYGVLKANVANLTGWVKQHDQQIDMNTKELGVHGERIAKVETKLEAFR